MNILLVHNFYQQPGGEDVAFAEEANLLEGNGHAVFKYTLHNDIVAGMSPGALVASTVWNHKVARDIRKLIQQEQIEVCHFHNTFPLVSPAAYYAARAAGAIV